MDPMNLLDWAQLLPSALAAEGDQKVHFLLNHAWSYVYGLVAFLIFAAIIVKFGLGPIVKAIDNRDARIAEQLKKAEDTAAKAQELQAQLNKELEGAEARIAEMMADARKDAEANKQRIVEQGEEEVQARRDRALRDIDAARYQAIVDLRQEVAEVATTVAEKILRSELDAAKHQQLVEEAIQAFEQRQGSGG